MRLERIKFSNVLVFIITFTILAQALRFAYGTTSFLLFLGVGVYAAFKNPQKINSYYLWPILLYLFMCLSLLWSSNIDLTISGLMRLSPLIAIPLILNLGYKLSKDQYEKIFDAYSLIFTVMALVFMIMGLFNYLNSNESQYLFYHNLVSSSKLNAIYASSFAFVAYIWILIKKYNILLYQISALVLFIFITLLSSKILIGLTLLSSVFLLIYQLKLKYRFFFSILIVGFVMFFFVKPDNFISKRFFVENTTNTKEIFDCKNFTKVYPWTGLGIRLFQARVGFEILKDNPSAAIFGLGFNASQPFIQSKHKKYNLYPGYYEYNFHNQYLQTFVELGFIGLVILFICLFQILKCSFRQKELFPLFIFVLFLVLFISESYLMRQRGIIFFTLLYAIIPKNGNHIEKK